MFRPLVHGALAGAAGTTALNAATYIDMSVRGRPASSTPEDTVEALAEKVGHPISGRTKEEEANRRSGLGALSGIATGVGVGVVSSGLSPLLTRMPPWIATVLLGAGAMAASDVTMARLGVTDPTRWTTADWLSDALPHIAFGAAAAMTLRAIAGRDGS